MIVFSDSSEISYAYYFMKNCHQLRDPWVARGLFMVFMASLQVSTHMMIMLFNLRGYCFRWLGYY